MLEDGRWGFHCTCERCGHRWSTYRKEPPKSCAGCKSKAWNKFKPKTNEGLLIPFGVPMETVCKLGEIPEGSQVVFLRLLDSSSNPQMEVEYKGKKASMRLSGVRFLSLKSADDY